MTFSLAARSADGRLFGMAISSSSPAVAARCAHARAGVGVVASQNITDPALGPAILDRMARGGGAQRALDAALAATPHAAYRQVLVVAGLGPPALHSGAQALGVVATAAGRDAVAAGNLLANPDVPRAMLAAFDSGNGHLAARLMAALAAGAAMGGEAGPVHSAGLLVVRDVPWPIVDLRVDWSDTDPVGKLATLWTRYQPQMDVYVQRALDPGAAPSFGVPGNL